MAERFLIYSDLDGTLLDHYSYQATEALPMLAQLSCANIPVILNTSKTYTELLPIVKELALTSPFIVENGAAVYLPKQIFSQQPEDTQSCGDFWCKSFCMPRAYWLELLHKQCQQYQKDYIGFSQLSVTTLGQLTGLSEQQAQLALQREYGEPLYWSGSASKKREFVEHITQLGAVAVQGGRFLHVSGYCDKGQAMIWLTELYRRYFGYDEVVTIALGDGENDITMLEAASIGVQVRSPVHGFPTLTKHKVLMQTEHCGPKGWSEAIAQLLHTQLTSEVQYG